MNKLLLLALLAPALASACIPAPGVIVSLEGAYEIDYGALDALGVPYSLENQTVTYYSQFDERVAIELNNRHLIAAPFADDFDEAYKQNQLIDWSAVIQFELAALANAQVLVIPDASDAAECAAPSVIVGKNPPEEFLVTKECGEWKQYSDNGLKDGNARTFGCGGTLLQGVLPVVGESPASPSEELVIAPFEPVQQKGWLEQIIGFFKSLFGLSRD